MLANDRSKLLTLKIIVRFCYTVLLKLADVFKNIVLAEKKGSKEQNKLRYKNKKKIPLRS